MATHSELTKFLRTPVTTLIATAVTKGHIYSLEEGCAFEVFFASPSLAKEFEQTRLKETVTVSQLLGPRKSICEVFRTNNMIAVTKFRKVKFYLRCVEFDADNYKEGSSTLPASDSNQRTPSRPIRQVDLESVYSFADLPDGVAKAKAYYRALIDRQLETKEDPEFFPKLTMLFKVSKDERTRIKATTKKLTARGMSAISQLDAAAFVRLWEIRVALQEMVETSGETLLTIGNYGWVVGIQRAALIDAIVQWHNGQLLLTEIMKQILKEKESS